jgi:hypothetical protein
MSYTQELRNIIAQIRSVLKGDTVEPEDHNLQTDCIKKIANLLDDLDTRIKGITQKNYKLIAWGYKSDYVRGGASITVYSSLNGTYTIGTDTFPVINQVLQPYDLLKVDFEAPSSIALNIPSGAYGIVQHSYSSINYISDEAKTTYFSYLTVSEKPFYYVTNEVDGVSRVRSNCFSMWVIIPPDLSKLSYYSMLTDSIGKLPTNVTIFLHTVQLIQYIFLYRLT